MPFLCIRVFGANRAAPLPQVLQPLCQHGQLSLTAARSVGRSAVERVLATAGPSCGVGGRYDSHEGAQLFLSDERRQKMVQMVQHLVRPHTVATAV